MKTIVLADDHNITRTGLLSLIEKIDGLKIIGEASDGEEALNMVKTLRPDLLITDISMPKMSGLDVIKIIKSENLDVKILVISMHLNERYITRCIELGASGYVLKDTDNAEIIIAIETIMSGGSYICKRAMPSVMEGIRNPTSQKKEISNLSKREKEILQYLVKGKTNKEIAEELFLSAKTIDSHRTNIMKKMKVHNSAELVWKAVNSRIIPLDFQGN